MGQIRHNTNFIQNDADQTHEQRILHLGNALFFLPTPSHCMRSISPHLPTKTNLSSSFFFRKSPNDNGAAISAIGGGANANAIIATASGQL
jgi:hypothetical protein